ncbi:MAG: hypothetical protein FWC50_03450 [Planctomycetaceae bacterium]|nr:hypothetical protein [Planctomycetaceae bacterium]
MLYARQPDVTPDWDVYSDTWDATDNLERSLPTSQETGPPRSDKFIGVFYFLWHGRHGDEGPYDVNKILAQDPEAMQKKDSPLWGKIYVPHHWGESIFHYYVGEDESVLRKHAQMLGDAGIDVVIFDVTNQLTYPESYRALCKVFSEVRAAGNHTPQIAFLTPFWAPKKVVHELWSDFYGKGEYSDLWFRWKGKPLILADPKLIGGDILETKRTNVPQELVEGKQLQQMFTANQPFDSVGAAVPTWETKNSSVELMLYQKGYDETADEYYYSSKYRQTFQDITDNQWLMLDLKKPFPPGDYILAMQLPKGKVGWWHSEDHPVFKGNKGFESTHIDSLSPSGIEYVRDDKNAPFAIRIVTNDEETAKIRDFFTFRKPQPDYFAGPTGPNQWGWLEVFPQHPFYVLNDDGNAGNGNKVPEQMAVGVAQNAVDGKLGVLSNPRSHGRSFHDGKEPEKAEQDDTGRNFNEQWQRALEIDPPFIFVTGWNEWIMGRFDETAPFHGAGVVSFVDQFNTEFSRDIEPMTGGHDDNYYYQLVANIRKYKGTHPVPPVEPKPIRIDGSFEDWENVKPEFRDTIGDPVRRDERGWGKGTRYVNNTGRNDLVVSKVSYDKSNIYFYVRTAKPIVGAGEANWMMLFIDADGNHKTGWLGYDFIVNRLPLEEIKPGNDANKDDANEQVTRVTLEKNIGDKYEWNLPVTVACRVSQNELELAIPKSILFGKDLPLPSYFHFKWADNIRQTGDWSDLTVNGDVAPNDRCDYRVVFEVPPK